MGWDGINYWYWCLHRSKVCSKAHRLPSKAFRQFGQQGYVCTDEFTQTGAACYITIFRFPEGSCLSPQKIRILLCWQVWNFPPPSMGSPTWATFINSQSKHKSTEKWWIIEYPPLTSQQSRKFFFSSSNPPIYYKYIVIVPSQLNSTRFAFL